MKFLKNIFFILLLTGNSNSVTAQIVSSILNQNTDPNLTVHPTCGSHHLIEHVNEKQENFLELSGSMMQQINELISAQSFDREEDDLYTIPVVFHILHSNADQNLADSVILRQLEILNEAFRRKNADTVNMRSDFLPHVGDALIEFKLAEVDPFGTPTIGITRTNTTVSHFGGVLPYGPGQTQDITDWVEDSLYYNWFRMTQSSLGGQDAWNEDEYLNVWIGDLRILQPQFSNFEELVFLGLATPPVDHINWPDSVLQELSPYSQGVLMHYVCMGDNNPVQFPPAYNVFNGLVNTGKILVHEVGHYLGLRHIWGDGNCSVDDFIADTPNSTAATGFTNCNPSFNVCTDNIGGLDLPNMIENYMDYSTGDCQNSFTKGQINLMRSVLENYRIDLAESTSIASAMEVSPVDNLLLYPNPSSGQVFIEMSKVEEAIDIMIQNSNGQLVYNNHFENSQTLMLGLDLSQGLYFVQISTGNFPSKVVKLILE